MAPTTSKTKQTGRAAQSKAPKSSKSKTDEEEMIESLAGLLSMTKDVRRGRRQQIKGSHKQQCQQTQNIIGTFYDNAKKQLLARQSDRIQKLAKLARDQARLETQVLERVRRLEFTYSAAKADVLVVLRGRLEELRGGTQ